MIRRTGWRSVENATRRWLSGMLTLLLIFLGLVFAIAWLAAMLLVAVFWLLVNLAARKQTSPLQRQVEKILAAKNF